jgi:hypothetical protein
MPPRVERRSFWDRIAETVPPAAGEPVLQQLGIGSQVLTHCLARQTPREQIPWVIPSLRAAELEWMRLGSTSGSGAASSALDTWNRWAEEGWRHRSMRQRVRAAVRAWLEIMAHLCLRQDQPRATDRLPAGEALRRPPALGGRAQKKPR